MCFDFLRSVQTEPVIWLPLDHAIHEVRSLHGPILWNVALLDLNLFGQNLVPDLLSVPPQVGSLSSFNTVLTQNLYGQKTFPIMHS